MPGSDAVNEYEKALLMAVKVVDDPGSETAEDMPEYLKVVEQMESFEIANERRTFL